MTDNLNKLDDYIEQLNVDYEASSEVRDKANEELRFSTVPGGQWEGYLEDAYTNRAKMEVDQVSDYIDRTYARWTDKRYMPTYSADSSDAGEEESELLENLLRRDMRRENGQAAIDTAVYEAMACGVGAFKLSTKYEDDEDEDSDDQVVVVSPIANSYSTVVWDSSASRADKSDAKRCVLLTPYPKSLFEEKWPDAHISDAKRPMNRGVFNWGGDGESKVYVATRYDIKIESRTIMVYSNMASEEVVKVEKTEKDLIEELVSAGFKLLREKKVKAKKVYKTVFSGDDILEEEKIIAGKCIPVFPIYAYRTFVDGQEFYHGLVRKRMDLQRSFNAIFSLAAEGAANNPMDKLIFDPEQMKNPTVAASWAANTAQQPYLLAGSLRNQKTGDVIQSGPTGVAQGASLSQASQTLIGITIDLMRAGTGGAPQDVMDTDASGKAINALLQRADMNTQLIFDNIKQSLQCFGRAYRDVAKEIYTNRVGRQIKTVSREDKSNMITLLDIKGEGGKITYLNDLRKGKYESVVSTGASHETQKEMAVEQLKDIHQAFIMSNPNDPIAKFIMMKIIHELPLSNLDDVKDYARNEMLMAGFVKPKTDEEKAMMAEMAQQPQQPDPMMIAAQAEAAKGEAALMSEETKRITAAANIEYNRSRNKIAAFDSQTKRMAEHVNAAEAKANIDFKRLDHKAKFLSGI
jgi:hypothetical protein